MDRELKFRAYDTRSKNMVDLIGFKYVGKLQIQLFYLDTDGDQTSCTCNKKFIKIMRYTGRLTEEKKEVCEDDIFSYHFNKKIVGIVRFGSYKNICDDEFAEHIGFYVDWQDEQYSNTLRRDLGYWCKVTEVIGNIHLNPELLNLNTP